jgi:signal transduction histidine kinase
MRLETRGFTLSRVSAGGPTLVRADPEALKQIILNLLSNAEKYSPQQKEIEVGLEGGGAAGQPQAAAGSRQAAAGERASTSVLIHVRDRGIGVAAEDRERIFREFFRVDDSLSSRVQGSGLGLTIARRIARDHGGELVCAPREGGGSDFIVSLPAADDGSQEDRS